MKIDFQAGQIVYPTYPNSEPHTVVFPIECDNQPTSTYVLQNQRGGFVEYKAYMLSENPQIIEKKGKIKLKLIA